MEQMTSEGDRQRAPTVQTLGARIRDLRLERRLTLEALALRAGVSSGLLSQLERGQGNPSFNTLVQVAHALSVPIAQLVQPEPSGSPLVRADARRQLAPAHTVEGVSVELLTPPGHEGVLEASLTVAPPGYSTEATPFSFDGEKFVLLLEGRHEIHLDGVRYELEAGDAMTFSSRITHWYRNPTDEPIRVVTVTTPSTF